MLSRQSSMKLKSLIAPLSGRALEDVQETLDEVKELCELSDSDSEDSDGTHSVDELSAKIAEALEDLDVPIDFKELLKLVALEIWLFEIVHKLCCSIFPLKLLEIQCRLAGY